MFLPDPSSFRPGCAGLAESHPGLFLIPTLFAFLQPRRSDSMGRQGLTPDGVMIDRTRETGITRDGNISWASTRNDQAVHGAAAAACK